MPQTIRNRRNPPQNGAVTHHQDQAMTPHSFRTTKATPSKPRTPMPLELEEDEDMVS